MALNGEGSFTRCLFANNTAHTSVRRPTRYTVPRTQHKSVHLVEKEANASEAQRPAKVLHTSLVLLTLLSTLHRMVELSVSGVMVGGRVERNRRGPGAPHCDATCVCAPSSSHPTRDPSLSRGPSSLSLNEAQGTRQLVRTKRLWVTHEVTIVTGYNKDTTFVLTISLRPSS